MKTGDGSEKIDAKEWYVWSVNEGVDQGQWVMAETPEDACTEWFRMKRGAVSGILSSMLVDTSERVAVAPYDAVRIYTVREHVVIKAVERTIVAEKEM